MGLNDNTKNIELALREKNTIQKQKETERLRKQEEKENAERLAEDIKEAIRTEFQRYLDIAGVSYSIEFYSIERKNEILQDILATFGTFGNMELKKEGYKGTTIQFYNNKKDIEKIFNDNYYKILKQEETTYKLNDKYLYNKQLQEFKEEPGQKKSGADWFKVLKYIFYIIGGVVFFPIVFLGLLVFAVCKNSR